MYSRKEHKMLSSLCASDRVYWNFSGFVLPRSLRTRTSEIATVLCNNVFIIGDDEQPITPREIPRLFSAYDAYGDTGLIAWVSLKRGVLPIRRHRRFQWFVDSVGEM